MSRKAEPKEAVPKVVIGSSDQAEIVIAWLERAQEAEDDAGGFYNNRRIIRSSARDSDLRILLVGRSHAGFAVITAGDHLNAIDILAIRPEFRGKGYGRLLAESILSEMRARGASKVAIQCCPRSSAPFWRKLGFVPTTSEQRPGENIRMAFTYA